MDEKPVSLRYYKFLGWFYRHRWWPQKFWGRLYRKEERRLQKISNDRINAAFAKLCKTEGDPISKVFNDAEVEYFRGWNSKWNDMKNRVGQGPF